MRCRIERDYQDLRQEREWKKPGLACRLSVRMSAESAVKDSPGFFTPAPLPE
jgi:hypothetical protein